MQVRGIQLISGYHLTAVERKSIVQMLNSGMINARNRPNTKSYVVYSGTQDGKDWIFEIKVGSKATWTIGGNPEWRYQTVKIKTTS